MNPRLGQIPKQNSGITFNENDPSHDLAFKTVGEISNQFDSEEKLQTQNSSLMLKFNNSTTQV